MQGGALTPTSTGLGAQAGLGTRRVSHTPFSYPARGRWQVGLVGDCSEGQVASALAVPFPIFSGMLLPCF